MSMKYAVTAATGHFGQYAVSFLTKKAGRENIVAIARNAEKAKKLFPGLEIRQGDYDDAASMTKALQGVDRVLFISSQPGGAVPRPKQHEDVVEALQKAGVKFVAYTSFPDAQHSKSALAADHKTTEDLIVKSGLPHAFLRDNWYLEDEIAFLQMGAKGKSASYWADGKAGWALEREYAEAAVNVLTADRPKEIYELAGPLHTYEELGEALQKALGKKLSIRKVSREGYTKLLEQGGLAPAMASLFASFQDPIEEGSLAHASGDLEDALGHPALGLAEAVKEILSR